MAKYFTTTFTLPNGKRKYIRAATKTELAQKLAAAKTEAGLGIDICDTTTVKEYAENWLRLTKTGKISENTEANLRARLANHIYPYIGSLRIRDVRASHILNVMQQCSGLSRGSQLPILGALRAIFNAAVDDSLILRSPVPLTLRVGGDKPPETEALTDAQLSELLENTRGLLAWPFIYAISQTGMRRSEVTALLWSDIDFENLVIHVRRHAVTSTSGKVTVEDGAKTDAGVRDIPITSTFAAWLADRRRFTASVFVFPNRKGGCYSASAFSGIWDTAASKVDFRVRSHQIRHTYITTLFEAGLDIKEIQRISGHADPTVTLGTYTHYREAQRSESTAQKVREALG